MWYNSSQTTAAEKKPVARWRHKPQTVKLVRFSGSRIENSTYKSQDIVGRRLAGILLRLISQHTKMELSSSHILSYASSRNAE